MEYQTRMTTSYHYGIIRYCPDLSCGEFCNIGIALWVQKGSEMEPYPIYKISEGHERLFQFFPDLDPKIHRDRVRFIKSGKHLLYIAKTSQIFIISKSIGGGYTSDPEKRLEELFNELVLGESKDQRFCREYMQQPPRDDEEDHG